jgi:hypothetical protein
MWELNAALFAATVSEKCLITYYTYNQLLPPTQNIREIT